MQHDLSSVINYSKYHLGDKALERIDLLLLVVESLDLNSGQGILWTSKKLGLEELFPNQVALWKCRCHNPLRKSRRRGSINFKESEGLIVLTCHLADRIYPMVNQLLSSREPSTLTERRWIVFSDRLKELIKERYNLRRTSVKKLLEDQYSKLFFRELLVSLALCAGPGGVNRLRASLLDSY